MFILDPRLEQDTCVVGQLALSELLLMDDALYPWCILVPRLESVREIFHLSDAQQVQWWQEVRIVAQVMQQAFAADKMNIATLGNVVSQLHMHVIVRKRQDVAWPAPVWGKHIPIPYTDVQRQEQLNCLRTRLRTWLLSP